jgi:hypothetical protein
MIYRVGLLCALVVVVSAVNVFAGVGVTTPVTAQVQWQWDDERPFSDVLQFAPYDQAESPILRLCVEESGRGWIPTWDIRLHFVDSAGSRRSETLGPLMPQPGECFEAIVSYHSQAGIVAVAIHEHEDQRLLGAGTFEMTKTFQPFNINWPDLATGQISPVFRPVADTIVVGQIAPSGKTLSTHHLSHDDDLVIDIASAVALPGEYRVTLEPQAPDFDLTTDNSMMRFRAPLAGVPPGPARLTVTYVEAGQAVPVLIQPLLVGRMDVAFTWLRVDHQAGKLVGSMLVEGSPPGVWLQVEAEHIPLLWDRDLRKVVAKPPGNRHVVWEGPAADVGATFAVDLPRQAGHWSLVFSVVTRPEIAVSLAGGEVHLQVAASKEEGPMSTLVAATDQRAGDGAILVLDAAVGDWNDPAAVVWRWQPKVENGFGPFLRGWGNPSGVKLRYNESLGGGGLWMVVTDSKGLAAIVPYPSGGLRQWAQVIGGNLHSAELLPDGNIALAASTGGWVRVYTSSQGPDSGHYVEYALKGAHGVLWNPRHDLLWALGDDELVGLRVLGTPSDPSLELVMRQHLPTKGGHDLAPVYGEPGRLWVTTGSRVYQYDTMADVWLDGYFGAEGLARQSGVKGVGDGPDGQIVAIWPRPGSLHSWTTDTVHLFHPDGVRVQNGAAFYKVRVWLPGYE